MVKKLFLSLLIFISIFFATQTKVLAADCTGVLEGVGVTLEEYQPGMTHDIKIDLSSYDQDEEYYIKVKNFQATFDDECQTDTFPLNQGSQTGSNSSCRWYLSGSVLTLTLTGKEPLSPAPSGTQNDVHVVNLYRREPLSNLVCRIGEYYTPQVNLGGNCSWQIWQGSAPNNACYYPGCLEINKSTTIKVMGLEMNGQPYNEEVQFEIYKTSGFIMDQNAQATGGEAQTAFTPTSNSKHTISIQIPRIGRNYTWPDCIISFTPQENCGADQCNSEETTVGGGPRSVGADVFSLCDQIPEANSELREKCIECAGGEGGLAGIWTAIGCIKRDPQAIVEKFIKLGLGMGGGVALLSFLAAGFIYSTSQGSPEKVKSAKEMMTASIVGILFVIFSVTLLQFIGWSIFKIPGFGG
ncbi:MAG: hypothetical protein H6772_03495 [Pseudomonadales bacterium]|nr:hypothetical protein [Pseudomonadales bacterium]